MPKSLIILGARVRPAASNWHITDICELLIFTVKILNL